jgi:hypothetical protein
MGGAVGSGLCLVMKFYVDVESVISAAVVL